MCFQSQIRWLPATLVATALSLIAASEHPAAAQAQAPRLVSADSLIYDLRHPDPVRRQSAARELGLAKYAPATPTLVTMAGDPDVSVRREVELSLEQIEDPRVVRGFVQFISDTEKDIRERAVHAAVSLYLPRATGPGATLAKIGNFINPWWDEFSDTVIDAEVTVDPEVVAALRARMSDPEIKVRRGAARGLGVLQAGPAIPELVHAVGEDRDDQVRFEAVRSLRKIGNPSVAASLMPVLNLNNDKVRQEIIETLGKLRYRGGVSELTRIFDRSKPTDRMRPLILSALADIADPSSRAFFQTHATDKNGTIRLYAEEGLARLADASQVSTVSGDRLAEKDARVRTAQAFALLQMGQVEYLDELVRGMGRIETRALSREYLLETKPTDRALLFSKRDKNPLIRAELAEVFGIMGDQAAMPALLELARDSDGTVVQAAERAIRRINAPRPSDGAQVKARSLPDVQ